VPTRDLLRGMAIVIKSGSFFPSSAHIYVFLFLSVAAGGGIPLLFFRLAASLRDLHRGLTTAAFLQIRLMIRFSPIRADALFQGYKGSSMTVRRGLAARWSSPPLGRTGGSFLRVFSTLFLYRMCKSLALPSCENLLARQVRRLVAPPQRGV